VNVFIEIVSGPEKGRMIQLSDNQLLRVGRLKHADVVLSLDKSVSSIHFSLECTQQSCHLIDLKSRNGTFLNGRRITESLLKTGDKIFAGHTTFVVSILEEPLPTSTPVHARAAGAESIGSGEAAVASTGLQQTAALPALSGAPVAARDAPASSVTVPKEPRATRVARSPRRFYVELYEEHLEEASFLYTQRLTLLDDAEIAWVKLAEWEERLEAHVDALVVGEDLALEVCEKRAAEGDFGELFAAVCVFCRQKRLDLLQKVLEPLDPGEAEKLQSVADALKYECPSEWQADIAHALPEGDPRQIVILATLYGYRRLKVGDGWPAKLDILPAATLDTVAWAIGRIRHGQGRNLLQTWLGHENAVVRSAAVTALLRLGEHKMVQETVARSSPAHIPWSGLAVGATRREANMLLAHVAREKPTSNQLIALGVLGDIAAVPVLLAHLPNEELAAAAALALNLITGAELYEKAFIPEMVDEDELFEDERAQVKQGQPLLRPDGKPYGENVVRFSQKAADWQRWWDAHRSRLKTGIRYRNGKPFSPLCLLENLESAKLPRSIRQLAYEELVIRYGADIPFETDMPVTQQVQALAQYRAWVEGNAARFQDGTWFLACRLQA
jgi:uncharacterized protein (TIGR02270 family)